MNNEFFQNKGSGRLASSGDDSCIEKSLEPSVKEKMLEAVFSSIGDAVYFTDTDRRIIAWNKAAEELTGYSAEEALNKKCASILNHQDDNGNELCETYCHLTSAIKGKNNIFIDEIWMNTKSGKRVPVEVSCSPVISENGDVMGVVEVFRNRTRQKELEQLREEFIATITHDLKSPLASIMGFAELIEDPEFGNISEKKIEYAKSIRRSGDILLGLIRNIVSVSRIEAGQMSYVFTDFSFNEFLEELRDTFEPLALKGRITFDFQCPEGVMINADKPRIDQVFHNLVSNALRYTPPGGTISIKAVPGAEKVEIEVGDTGKGVRESDRPHIFEKYSQGRGEKSGTGLGLYIAKKILEGHGSEISLKSGQEEGTHFYFSLPKGKETVEIKGYKGKILIIGDDETSGLAYSFLEEQGNSLASVASGMEGLQKIKQFMPDLVLLYHRLPDLEVKEFLHAFDSEPENKNIPVIFLTAILMPEIQNKFHNILQLPLDVHALNRVIQETLKNKSFAGKQL
ncbi:MAG: ATP-binding protein [Chloroflexi bacterium]|nr:ATP-binding protein [Chloroflexota bacterium]